MPFITVAQNPDEGYQISLMDILAGEIPLERFQKREWKYGTRTYFTKYVSPKLLGQHNILYYCELLKGFNERHADLFEKDRKSLYRIFAIPKKSGGVRWISAPNDELMNALRELKDIFENKIGALYHTNAYAYIHGRCTIDSIKRHQGNESKWFLKTDFSNFFGSTTKEFILSMLGIVFPYSEILCYGHGREQLSKAIDLCMLDGGLPQGTPISPLITNMMMIPFDSFMSRDLRKRGFVYTRYADDILISHKKNFRWSEITSLMNRTLEGLNAPFRLKNEKTRYGSSAGSNWNLGVMLNKDNKITIGHKKKKCFEATLNDYLRCRGAELPWTIEQIYTLSGQISYYKMVESDYVDRLLKEYGEKYHIDVMTALKRDTGAH